MNSPLHADPIVAEDMHYIVTHSHDALAGLQGKTLLLTGGSGFVGSYLVESLIAFNRLIKGPAVTLLLPTRSISRAKRKWPHFFGYPSIIWFEWDGKALAPTVGHCDYLIHAASPVDPHQLLENPSESMNNIVAATTAVLDFAKKAGVASLLFLSSGAVYGQQPAPLDAITEDYSGGPSLDDPCSCYGEAKRHAELLCQISGVPVAIARLFAFMGPYQDLTGTFAVPDFIRQATERGTIHIRGNGKALRTYCYASDLTIGLWKLLVSGTPRQVYNVGASGPGISILELATMIAETVGGVRIEIDNPGAEANTNRSVYIPDISRFSKIHAPQIGLQESITRTLASLYCRKLITLPKASPVFNRFSLGKAEPR